MKYMVYHDNEPTFMSPFAKFSDPPDPKRYSLVAEVECETLEDAFRLTNSIDRSWTENSEVLVLGDRYHHRSTSVGDVIVNTSGQAWRCEMAGWSKIQ